MGNAEDKSKDAADVVVWKAEDAQGKTVKGKTSRVTESELRRRLEDRRADDARYGVVRALARRSTRAVGD